MPGEFLFGYDRIGGRTFYMYCEKRTASLGLRGKPVYLVLLLYFVFGGVCIQEVFARGRACSGLYQGHWETGENGTVNSNTVISAKKMRKEQSAPNQYQKIWQRNVEKMWAGNAITRNVKITDAEGSETAYTRVTIEKIEIDKE